MIYVLQKLFAKPKAGTTLENALYVVYGKEDDGVSAIYDVYEIGYAVRYDTIVNDYPIEIEVAKVHTTKSWLNELRRAKTKNLLPLVVTTSGL